MHRVLLDATNLSGDSWHLAAIFGELHEAGGVHGFIHPTHIGLDTGGRLQIRPALSAFIPSDPDDEAAALATDCWQLSFVLQKMGVVPSLDRRFGLLMSGLRQEVSRLRLQPASAIRQTLTAVIARHPEWEDEIGQRLGKQWTLDYSPVKEDNVVPHRLSQPSISATRPQKSRVEVDVWASPFIRTMMENNDHSSGQAMIREALRNTSNPKKFELPVMEDFQLEDEVTELEPARIQIPRNEVQILPPQQNRSENTVELPQEQRNDRSLSLEPVKEILLEEEAAVVAASAASVQLPEETKETVVEAQSARPETAALAEASVEILEEESPIEESATVESDATDIPVQQMDESQDADAAEVPERIDPEERGDNLETELAAERHHVTEDSDVVSEQLEPEDFVEEPSVSFESSEENPSIETEPPEIEEAKAPPVEKEEATPSMEIDFAPIEAKIAPEVETEAQEEGADADNEKREEDVVPFDTPADESVAETVLSEDMASAEGMESGSEVEPVEDSDAVVVTTQLEESPEEQSMYTPLNEAEKSVLDVAELVAEPEAVVAVETPAEVALEPINFEDEVEETVVVKSNVQTETDVADSKDGYVAELASTDVTEEPKETLDVQEPLANIRLPSIEEVRAEQSERIGNVEELFESPSIRIDTQNAPDIEEELYPEPKWADAIGVNLDEVNEEQALGDEKYAVEGSSFGDVSAAFEGSVREIDFEERGSYWGWVLILAVAFVFGIVYVMQPRMTQPTVPVPEEKTAEGMGGVAVEKVTQFSTNPPGGTIYVDRQNKGVEPIMFTLSNEKKVYLICVDWGMNPICRNVPKKELEKESYTFSKEQ